MKMESNKKIIYIKSCRGVDAGSWFQGSGYYYIDEDNTIVYGGSTRELAEAVYIDYVVDLQKLF